MKPTANKVLELVTYLREQASCIPSNQPQDSGWQNCVIGALRDCYEGNTSEVNRELLALVPVPMRGKFAAALGPLHGYLGRYTVANNSKILTALTQVVETMEEVRLRLQVEEQRADQTFASSVQGSIVAASALGHDGQAHGTINIHHHHRGLGYADVTQIVDERLALAFARLRESVGQTQSRNSEDMLRVSFAVVQALVAAKLGAAPAAASVAEFLRAAIEDPAFPARAARLFQEGTKTPSAKRREMLARALFGIPATTPDRDRIDAAIERLFPEDVLLLRALIMCSMRGASQNRLCLVMPDGNRSKYVVAWPGTEPFCESPDRVRSPDVLICSLQSAGCMLVSSQYGGYGSTGRFVISEVILLPLGHSVTEALESAGAQQLTSASLKQEPAGEVAE